MHSRRLSGSVLICCLTLAACTPPASGGVLVALGMLLIGLACVFGLKAWLGKPDDTALEGPHVCR